MHAYVVIEPVGRSDGMHLICRQAAWARGLHAGVTSCMSATALVTVSPWQLD